MIRITLWWYTTTIININITISKY